MGHQKNPRPLARWKTNHPTAGETELRIVGGDFGGRKIKYTGDPRTRPMKDVTREAMFNLVGGFVPGKLVIDLFAGSGAVGIEALSRGAVEARFVERHFPTARVVRENLEGLGLSGQAEVDAADAFFWFRKWLRQPPLDCAWCVFICPPYAFFKKKSDELKAVLQGVFDSAPENSVMVVEAPESLPEAWFPDLDRWRFKHYPPARIAIWRPTSFENDQAFSTELNS